MSLPVMCLNSQWLLYVYLIHHWCKYLFVVYAFFSLEASCYESCLVSHKLLFRSQHRILDIILLELVLFDHSLLPFLLVYFFIAGRLCINDVAQHCHITGVCLRPLEVSSYYSSFWIIFWTVVTCSSEQVSSLFSCRWLYVIFPKSQMHLYG